MCNLQIYIQFTDLLNLHITRKKLKKYWIAGIELSKTYNTKMSQI